MRAEQDGATALIAGEGALPVEIARRLSERGKAPLVITMRSDTDTFHGIADPLIRFRYPKLSRVVAEMRKHGVRSVIMAGFVPKKLIYFPALFDPLTLKYLARIPRDDHSLLAAVVDIMESNGISVLPYWHILPEFLASEGQLGHRLPTEKEERDAEYGAAVLKVTLPCSFGQALVVADGAVVAVEALEGTDAMIKRAGSLVSKGVLVKMMRPDQDLRYDLPTVGPDTIENMAVNGLTCLAVEARRTLIVEAQKTLDLARLKNIAIWGLPCQCQ
ncbi:MAG: UDP-2,3-diacylglucosamine diphosphatase LpxI [Synergistaceae bacterium]|nr:UDP-2,3-diacylglucosamine diphosphatase LpxI [Synergistaceae bacterium]